MVVGKEDLVVYVKMDTKQFKEATKDIMGFNAKVNKLSPAFAGWAMSVMFAGMAIQRTMSSITKSAVSTFNEITHSVEGQVTSADMLAGSWKYLQFTIGEALDPLLDKLIPIVDKIAEWVERNPELVAQIIAIGTVLGSLMMVGGGLYLAINGFQGMFIAMKAAIILFDKVFVPTLISGFTKIIPFITGPGGILLAFTALFVVLDALSLKIGGWGELFKSVIRGVLRMLVFLGQGLVDGLLLPLNFIIDILNGIINTYNKMASVIPGFKNSKIGNIKNIELDIAGKYMDWEKSSWLAPSEGYRNFDLSQATSGTGSTTNIYVNK
ncbi:MAG TPA: hypothetical protein V6C58_06575, partial [Allocoleopsis sp.]